MLAGGATVEPQPLIDHLQQVVLGRDDIRLECAEAIAEPHCADAASRLQPA
jgi:hypothetical protein